MHDLSFRTRGNSDFKGKPKVFFTAHPDDFDLYFDLISAEILDLQNRSVWYFVNQKGFLDEDDKFNLGTMNLFVVPISGQYLTENSFSSEQVIPFAVEHHISVMPIMEEPGIDGLFQSRFKNMQHIIDDPSDVIRIISKKPIEEIEDYIAGEVGKICLDFEVTHPLFDGSERIGSLGRVLTKNEHLATDMSERLSENKRFLADKIASAIMGKLDYMKYDEYAMIILSFCGFYSLKEAKHVIGGKNKALEDFYRFYVQRVFWKYNISEIKSPELWCHMTIWIHTVVDWNGVKLS